MVSDKSQKFKFTRVKVILAVAVFLLLTTGFAYATYETTANTIKLVKDGQVVQVETHASTVGEFLESRGISAGKHDVVKPSLDTPINDTMTVKWDRAVEVQFTVNGQHDKVWSTADSVKELLKAQGYKVKKQDMVKPSIDTALKSGMKINYKPAFKVKLTVGKKTKKVWATQKSVKDFLKAHNVKLDDHDKVKPGLKQTIKPSTHIAVAKVNKKKKVEYEALDYEVVRRADSSMNKGNEKVIESGQDGRIAKHYKVTKKNGKVVNKQLVKSEVVEASQPKVIAYGTNVVSSEPTTTSVSRGSGDNDARVIQVHSTAYTADCSGCSGITATGLNLKANPDAKVIAVDPDVIPLGSKVYVEGYGYAIAADTGGGINGNQVDVFFPSESRALQWGTKTVTVKILE